MSKIQDFTLSVDLLEAILWQYNEAEVLKKLVGKKQEWANKDIIGFLNDWYKNVFNIDTANDFGLSVWAKILNVNFSIPQPARDVSTVFGFGQYRKNFGNGNFKAPENTDYYLTTEQKRLVIKLTYLKYHTLPSVKEVNKIIRSLIQEDAYIHDSLDMSSSLLVLGGQIDYDKQFILKEYNLIPRPAGVGLKSRVITGREFGFGKYRNNFSNTSFFGNNTLEEI